MKKVGITTVFTGYNYGSLLQAFALQEYISQMGYDSHIVWCDEGMIKGRDVRLKKLFVMCIRMIWRPRLFRKGFGTYAAAFNRNLDKATKQKFLQFTQENLRIRKYSIRRLRRLAKTDEYQAFVCGSDQIWNATAMYVDPLYYLRFAPRQKRVAYAPSFGKDEIPPYNKKVIKKYMSEIPQLSIRERQGQRIIKELIDRDVPVMIDPTLLFDREFWLKKVSTQKKTPYLLLYFLDRPSDVIKQQIQNLINLLNVEVIVVPNKEAWHDSLPKVNFEPSGPFNFVELIANAELVCTDSFHGMVFAINLNVPFIIFQREYGKASDQSSRIESLLDIVGLKKRFVRSGAELPDNIQSINFNRANEVLVEKRNEAHDYLMHSISQCN